MTRFLLFIAGALAGFAVAQSADWSDQIGYSDYYVLFIFIVLGSAIGFILGGIIGRELTGAYQRLEERLRDLSAIEMALGAVGLLGGLVVGVILSYPLRSLQPGLLAVVVTLALLTLCGWLGVRLALIKRDDVSRAFPKLASSDVAGAERKKYLDTSAIIDGRFAELRRAGFLEGPVEVPRFVLAELQTLADSSDDVRRARGRRGLDLLTSLQETGARVDVFEIDYPTIPEVDHKLMRLAEDSDGVIVTVDHNLGSAARVKRLSVLNINELAAALRPTFLPGEKLTLRLIREGKEPGQGVGYLEDGTMVVVQEGAGHVGAEVETEVTSVLQTSGGRMVFAKMRRTG